MGCQSAVRLVAPHGRLAGDRGSAGGDRGARATRGAGRVPAHRRGGATVTSTSAARRRRCTSRAQSTMARYVELRRHTDSEGDALTEEGVRAALAMGGRLTGGYELLVSSGAQRATQTL